MKLLQSLGIQSTIFTDGKSPINLFNTAQGLIGNMTTSATAAVAPKVATSSRKRTAAEALCNVQDVACLSDGEE